MGYQELKAEVEDLQRRRNTLNRDERARLPWALKALRATPEQQELERATQRENQQFCREALRLLDTTPRR